MPTAQRGDADFVRAQFIVQAGRVLAIEHALATEQERLFLLTAGKTSDEDVDAILERSLDFMMHGWLAPARSRLVRH